MRRNILVGFICCLIAALGFLVMRRALVEKPQVVSRESASLARSKETDTKHVPAAATLDSGDKADSGGEAVGAAPSDKLAAVARELAVRLRSLAMNPQMREMVARRMAQDYAELFRDLHLSAEKEELLSQIIVDRFFSVVGPERDSYDQLTQELLTPDEFEKYAAYRDELPVKAMLKEVAGALQIDRGGAAADEVGRAIRSSSNPAARSWADVERKFMAGELNEADLSHEEQKALNQFDEAVAREVQSLSVVQRAALREWFRNSVGATVASIRRLKAGK